MWRVVLDTNVLMSAVINTEGTPAQVLAACRAGRFVLVVSEAILEEVDRVFQYPKVARFHQWSDERRRTFIEDLAHLAQRTPGTRQISAVEADPTDDRYLECAVEGQAQYLVTGDRHLLGLGSYEDIQILTPAVFWQHLEHETAARLERVQVRQAGEEDLPRLRDFYEQTGYARGVTPADVVVLAEEEGRIIGALRLCQEHGTLVLRGMRVSQERQRQGIGTRLLLMSDELIGQRTCYCLPHPCLEGLYGRIGFEKVKPASAPKFLQARQAEYREQGVDTILMKKSPKQTRKG